MPQITNLTASRSDWREFIPFFSVGLPSIKRYANVLFVRPKIADMGLHLFSRSVHPELMEACVDREVNRDGYVLRVQITTSGHLVSFRQDRLLMTEVCSGIRQALPSTGRLISRPIETERLVECELFGRIHWESRFQLEVVDPRVFLLIQEQLDKQADFEGLVHRFASSGRIPLGGVSYINIQTFERHVLLKAFHTFPDTCSVVKCESKFLLIEN